jgi:hypothetical protein
MIYMVEMDMPLKDREADWHDWYVAHLRKLLKLPGFDASQRFRSLTPTPSPFLAMHQVDSASLFESPGYKSTGGPASTGEWRDVMTNWYRNLFDGLAETPDVAKNGHLVVVEDGCRLPGEWNSRVHWLASVGLDRSAERRGLLVLGPAEAIAPFKGIEKLRIFRPISPRMTKAR